jgi:hypothetical protein
MFDIMDLLEAFKDATKAEELAEKVLDIAIKEKEILEERLIYYMQLNGIDSLDFDGNKLTLKVDIFPNVLVRDHAKLKNFLGEDASEVFTESPSKLRGYVGKMLDSNREIPDFIKLFPKETLKFKDADKKRSKKND